MEIIEIRETGAKSIRWAFGDWTGEAFISGDERGNVRFEWDQTDLPETWEDIEGMILKEIC